jgi:hypothetical protein
MSNKKDEIKKELNVLIKEAEDILMIEVGKMEYSKNYKNPPIFIYNSWYSKALPLVRQLMPERYKEFQELYRLEKRDQNNIDTLTYTISDYLLRLSITKNGNEAVDAFSSFYSKFKLQSSIIASANVRIDSILNDIEGVLQAELFDNDLDSADALIKIGYYRASGAIAGVTIEKHLGQVAKNHKFKLNKKNPTIADFIQKFKDEDILDIPDWRFLQRLADIRNLCVHKKERDPTKDEVKELIEGTRKIVKTLF